MGHLARMQTLPTYLRRPEGPPGGAPYSYRKEKETHELIFSWLSLLAVLLVGAYARRRRRSTTTTESRNMAAILQIIGWQRHAALVYRVLLWDWNILRRARCLTGSLVKTLLSLEIFVTSVGDLKLNSKCRQQFKCISWKMFVRYKLILN